MRIKSALNRGLVGLGICVVLFPLARSWWVSREVPSAPDLEAMLAAVPSRPARCTVLKPRLMPEELRPVLATYLQGLTLLQPEPAELEFVAEWGRGSVVNVLGDAASSRQLLSHALVSRREKPCFDCDDYNASIEASHVVLSRRTYVDGGKLETRERCERAARDEDVLYFETDGRADFMLVRRGSGLASVQQGDSKLPPRLAELRDRLATGSFPTDRALLPENFHASSVGAPALAARGRGIQGAIGRVRSALEALYWELDVWHPKSTWCDNGAAIMRAAVTEPLRLGLDNVALRIHRRLFAYESTSGEAEARWPNVSVCRHALLEHRAHGEEAAVEYLSGFTSEPRLVFEELRRHLGDVGGFSHAFERVVDDIRAENLATASVPVAREVELERFAKLLPSAIRRSHTQYRGHPMTMTRCLSSQFDPPLSRPGDRGYVWSVDIGPPRSWGAPQGTECEIVWRYPWNEPGILAVRGQLTSEDTMELSELSAQSLGGANYIVQLLEAAWTNEDRWRDQLTGQQQDAADGLADSLGDLQTQPESERETERGIETEAESETETETETERGIETEAESARSLAP